MFKALLAAVVLAAVSTSAQAQSSWTLDGSIGLVSDYRFRGISLSNERPALQGGLTASHTSGFYGDVFLSTIEEYGIGSDGDGAEIEVTGSLGWAGEIGGFVVDAAVSAYRYPDGDDVNYVEVPVEISRSIADLILTAGVAYAPSQDALGDEDNRYGWLGAEYRPLQWPFALTATIGREEGAFAPDGKTDWSLGASREFGPVALALSWVEADEVDGSVVASVFWNF